MEKLINNYKVKIDELLIEIGEARENLLPADAFIEINILTERFDNYNMFIRDMKNRIAEIESEEPVNDYSLETAFRYIPQIDHDEVRTELMKILDITNCKHLTRIIKGEVSPPYNIGKRIEHYLNIRYPTIRRVWQSKLNK